MAKKMSSPLIPIFLIVFVDILGFTIILPLLPFYTEKYGGSPSVYGLLVTSYAACQLFSGPILGQISDTVGRKPLLLVSQVGTCLGFLLLGFSTSLLMIFISRLIDGVTAGNLPLAQAYISDVTEPQNRSKALGFIGISFGLGFLIGPAISGFLSQFGYSYPAFASAFMSFLSIMATIFLLPGKKDLPPKPEAPPAERTNILHPRKYFKFFKDTKLRNLLGQYFMFGFGFSMFISGFALFAERRFSTPGHIFGAKQVGYLYAYSGLLGVIIQGGLIGRLVKKFGEARLVVWGFAAMTIGYAAVGWVSTVPILLIIMIFGSFGTGVLRPVITSLITQNAPRHEQGLILGLGQSLQSIGQIIAPLIAGFLISQYLLAGWAITAAASGVIGLFLALRLKFERN
jgi:DHA1 family tetracycline resistance protein-like MFS transporter